MQTSQLNTCFGVSKLLHRCFPVNFAEFSRKSKLNNFCERILKWNEITKKKSYEYIHGKTPVIASFIVQLQAWILADLLKRNSIADTFVWNVWSFTEFHFLLLYWASTSHFQRHFWHIACFMNIYQFSHY